MFEPYGEILDCHIITERATGVSRGCCFVLYASAQVGAMD